MTKEEYAELHRRHGGNLTRMAAEYFSLRDDATHNEMESARKRLSRLLLKRGITRLAPADLPADSEELEGLKALHALLRAQEIDPRDVSIKSARVGKKAWDVTAKVKEIDPQTGEKMQRLVTRRNEGEGAEIVFEPRCADGPAFRTVERAPLVIVRRPLVRKPSRKGVTVAMLYPDQQIGFLRDLSSVTTTNYGRESFRLHPIHDPAALDVALQLTADIRPDRKVHLGDLIDMSEWSRYTQHEEFWRTTQPAIDLTHEHLADLEAASPSKRVGDHVIIDGNHTEKRFQTYLLERARAAYGLRRAKETPKDWPTFSIAHLLRLDDLGISQTAPYPGGEVWLTKPNSRNPIVCRHDPSDGYDATVFCGHTHQVKSRTITRRTRFGPREFELWECGTLCRVDDVRERFRLMRTPVPSDRGFIKNWAQAVFVVTLDHERDTFDVEIIRIRNGFARYRDRKYVASAKTRKQLATGKAA